MADRAELNVELEALRPYHSRLIAMQGRLRPFGSDYIVIEAALKGLADAAEHFTGDADFYSVRMDRSRGTWPPLAP